MMARKEAELVKEGSVKFFNQELVKHFPHRSAEAIKKARQKTDYRKAVQNFLVELHEAPSSLVKTEAQGRSGPLKVQSQRDVRSAPTMATSNVGPLEKAGRAIERGKHIDEESQIVTKEGLEMDCREAVRNVPVKHQEASSSLMTNDARGRSGTQEPQSLPKDAQSAPGSAASNASHRERAESVLVGCMRVNEESETVSTLCKQRVTAAQAPKREESNSDVKARWTKEEVLKMARKEAELVIEGSAKFLNQELIKHFPHRSVQAIKKTRQKADYRKAVRDSLAELHEAPSSLVTTEAQGGSGPQKVQSLTRDARSAPTKATSSVGQLEKAGHAIVKGMHTDEESQIVTKKSSPKTDCWEVARGVPVESQEASSSSMKKAARDRPEAHEMQGQPTHAISAPEKAASKAVQQEKAGKALVEDRCRREENKTVTRKESLETDHRKAVWNVPVKQQETPSSLVTNDAQGRSGPPEMQSLLKDARSAPENAASNASREEKAGCVVVGCMHGNEESEMDSTSCIQRAAAEQTPERRDSSRQKGRQESGDDFFIDYLLAQTPLNTGAYRARELQELVENAKTIGKVNTRIRLACYLSNIFPCNKQSQACRKQPKKPKKPLSKRKARRKEYAMVQRLWTKHQGRCIEHVLRDTDNSEMPSQSVMEPYWRNIMERQASCTLAYEESLPVQQDGIWAPISCNDVRRSGPRLKTSPGPDGVSARELRAVPDAILMRVFNLILWCGELPEHLLACRTVFIPKSSNAREPGEFRPITISSVITRQLHSILSKRLAVGVQFDPRQRAFFPMDGCAENITYLDLLLRDHKQRHASCYLAMLDVGKAFDSLSHEAIINTLESFNMSRGFIKYIGNLYARSSTSLVGNGWNSKPIHPRSGVKQGDPMSPLLFNMVMDRLLRSLRPEIGCYVGSTKNNAIAFADDLTLFASTPQGLQCLIDDTQRFLTSCGLSLNSAKCKTLSIKGQPKQKTSVIERRSFTTTGREMPSLGRTDEFKYLGVTFTADGRCKQLPQQDLVPMLESLSKAPLKPQQRLHALRTVVLPKLYHRLTLGSVKIGSLNKVDLLIRRNVRKWLDLPNDVPIAFFHAPVSHGGLGIPSIRWQAPWLRWSRLVGINLPNVEPNSTANTFIATEIDRAERRLRVNGQNLRSGKDIEAYWSRKLYESVDGAGLRDAGKCKQAHRWLREPSKLLSGRDFVNLVRLRINALPTRSRTSRGRPEKERQCRAGCGVPETVNHIVQTCHRTHVCRMERHNAVVAYAKRSLHNRGYSVVEEPRLETSAGMRKPDIVANMGHTTIIFDAQVVTDGRNIEEAHATKIRKYSTEELKTRARERFGGSEVHVLAATLNWRGIWSENSLKDLVAMDVLRYRDAALVSTRVGIGSVRAFRLFNRTTSIKAQRKGIG